MQLPMFVPTGWKGCSSLLEQFFLLAETNGFACRNQVF